MWLVVTVWDNEAPQHQPHFAARVIYYLSLLRGVLQNKESLGILQSMLVYVPKAL